MLYLCILILILYIYILLLYCIAYYYLNIQYYRASRPPSDRLDPRRRAADGKCERIEQWKKRLHQHIADIYDNTPTATCINSSNGQGFNAQKWLEKFQQQCASINHCHTRLMSLRMRSEATLKVELDNILSTSTATAASTSAASIIADTNSPSTTSSSETSSTELERLLSPTNSSSGSNDSDVPAVVVVTNEMLTECYPHVPEPYRRVLYLLQKGMCSMYTHIYMNIYFVLVMLSIVISNIRYSHDIFIRKRTYSGPLWAVATVKRNAPKGQNCHLITFLYIATTHYSIYWFYPYTTFLTTGYQL